MKAPARSYNAPEQHFESAKVLVDIRGINTSLPASGSITVPNKHCMVFIDDNTGGNTLMFNNGPTIRTGRTQQAYQIPFEVTSYSWSGMATPNANSNVTIIGFN
jgi:hypothetical protein